MRIAARRFSRGSVGELSAYREAIDSFSALTSNFASLWAKSLRES
jgi:hypothetical protein